MLRVIETQLIEATLSGINHIFMLVVECDERFPEPGSLFRVLAAGRDRFEAVVIDVEIVAIALLFLLLATILVDGEQIPRREILLSLPIYQLEL